MMMDDDKATTGEVMKTADSLLLVQNMQSWIKSKRIATIIKKDELFSIIMDIKENPTFSELSKEKTINIVNEFITKAKKEKRTVKEIIGKNVTSQILLSIENTNIYDPETVKAFLQAPAIEKMIGGILYEAIFEFIQRGIYIIFSSNIYCAHHYSK